MRNKEYFELANRSLKLRKKSTLATIIAMAMGFAMIVPIIVALFGVNVSLVGQLNEKPYALYYDMTMSDYRIKTEDSVDPSTIGRFKHISGSNHIDYVVDNNNFARTIIYEQYNFYNGFDSAWFSINTGNIVNQSIDATKDSAYSIIDVEKSDSMFPTNLVNHYDGGIFLSGYDQSFTGNGKKQVVVSERFLKDNGLDASDVYLKPITINAEDELKISESDPVETSGYLCKDYTVVGVIKSDVTELYDRESYELMSSDMFFTSVNVYDNDGAPVLKPRYFQKGNNYRDRYMIYDNFENKDSLNNEYMMLGWNDGLSKKQDNNEYTYGSTSIYGESDSYTRMNQEVDQLNAYFVNVIGFKPFTDFVEPSETFQNYKLAFDITNIASLILMIISIVLGLSAFINMFCSVSHSVRERRQYLTMMRAIGAKDKDIPRLYLLESVIISSWASALISVIGFLLSMAVKLGFDSILKRNNITYALSIPWWTIFVTIIFVVIIVFAIGMMFSYAVTKRLSKQKINTLLNDI